MFGRQKTINCPAGQWTTVIHTSFAQLPITWTLCLQSETNVIEGDYEESKSSWIFPGTPTTGPMQAQMSFARGYWNTFYKLRFRPAQDSTVTIESQLG